MLKKVSKTLTAIAGGAFLVLMSQSALAAPLVQSVKPEGSQLVIGGSGFGTKTNPAPYRFDNWETAKVGQTPSQASNGFWNDGRIGGSAWVVDSSNRTPLSERSMSIDFARPGGGDALFERNEKFTKLYVNFWVRPDWGKADTSDGSWQIKYFRLNHDYPSIAAFGWARKNGDLTRTEWQHLTYNRAACGGSTVTKYQPLPFESKWVNVALAVDQSNIKAVKTLIMQSQADNDGPYFSSAQTVNLWGECASGSILDLIKFGGSAQSGGSSGVWRYDDIYIDKSWARIELGDAPNYTECTVREVQIPTLWSSNKVTVNLNQGSLAGSSKTYLFVIDENGDPSPGFAITLDGLSPDLPSAPSPPQNLKILN